MRLKGLVLRHFRNLGVQELAFPPEGVAILGENAQGKTNLLEAIYYLETFRSFRRARDDQLVAFDEPVFRVGCDLANDHSGEGTEVLAAYERSGKRKKITLDGGEPGRLGDALAKVGAVVFSPSDVGIVSEGPGERRRFLDIVLSLNVPGYLESLQRYRHILAQRNAALREEAPHAAVRAWDAGLIEAGASVMEARRRWIDERRESFGRYYRAISGGPSAEMTYASSLDLEGVGSGEAVRAAYRVALDHSSEREWRLGTTVVGPHRDDLFITVEGEGRRLEAREFGSGGQRRTAAVALRLVEAATIREERLQEPIVLLDDVFAELDEGRSERILGLIEREETGQVILTAPKESDVRIRKDTLARWRIHQGTVSV